MSGAEQGATVRTAAEVPLARTPTLGEAVHLALRVAEAVAVLHESGHVHGHLRGEDVLLAEDGGVALVGADSSIESTPVSRATDVRAVGRILAETLGADDPATELPAGIDELVSRAERAEEAPAAALALALRRLEQDPATAARLLPPPLPVLRPGRPLKVLVPRPERRRAGIVAGVVAVLAAAGVAMVVVGAPGGTIRLRPLGEAYAAPLHPAPSASPSASPSPAPTGADRSRKAAATLEQLLGISSAAGVPTVLHAPGAHAGRAARPHAVAAGSGSRASGSGVSRPVTPSGGTSSGGAASTRRGGSSATRPTSGGGSSTKPTSGGSSATRPTSSGTSSAKPSSPKPPSGGASSAPSSTAPSSTAPSSTAPSATAPSSTTPSSTTPSATTPSTGTGGPSSSAPSPTRPAPRGTAPGTGATGTR